MGLSLDQATALEHVGDTLYIGFNDDLDKIVFPKLKTIGGALIIEANPALKEIHLPALELVTKYVHVHDNAAVAVVDFAKLRQVGGELSFQACPALRSVRVAVASAPASVARYVVDGCGMPLFPTAHVAPR